MTRLALAVVAACSPAPPEVACPATVPAALAPTADQDLAFVWHGEGVQIYACANGAWTFALPRAALTTRAGDPAGTHFAGPSWRAVDGSSAVGRKVAEAPGAPAAIPWLALVVSSHDGTPGVLADVTAIQRLETTGGIAPATGCDAAHPDARVEVPYTANYYFYRKQPGATNRRCGG